MVEFSVISTVFLQRSRELRQRYAAFPWYLGSDSVPVRLFP